MPLDPTNALIGDWSTDNNANEPDGGDLRKQGDDQIRGAKGTIRRHFPNFTGTASAPKTVDATEDQINVLVGIGLTQPIVTLPVGAVMYFEAPATPGVGWVKKTSAAYDNIGLRVVTGTITDTTYGSANFDTVFSTSETGSAGGHAHTGETGVEDRTNPVQEVDTTPDIRPEVNHKHTFTTSTEPDHTHGQELRLRYRDVYAAEFQGY